MDWLARPARAQALRGARVDGIAAGPRARPSGAIAPAAAALGFVLRLVWGFGLGLLRRLVAGISLPVAAVFAVRRVPRGGEQMRPPAVVSLGLQFLAVGEFRSNVADVVLGDREHHRDRLNLSDDDDVGALRLHQVAEIDLAQADTAADRRDNARVGQID